MKPKIYVLISVATLTLVMWGCESPGKIVSHWIAPKSTGVKADQTGAVESPASADVSQTKVSTPIPAGSPVTVDSAGTVSVTPAKDTAVTVTGQSSHYTAPKAYAPPSPAAVAEARAEGDALRWYYLAGLGLLLAAGLAAWSGHYLAAVKFGFAAVAVPVLAHFFSEHLALGVGLAAAGIGVGLVLAWHQLNAKYNLEAKGQAIAAAAAPVIARAEASAAPILQKVEAAAAPVLAKAETAVTTEARAAMVEAEKALAYLKSKI